MQLNEMNIKDLAIWLVVTLGAQVAAIQDADLSSTHGKLVAVTLALSILAAALKSVPTFGQVRVNVPAVPAVPVLPVVSAKPVDGAAVAVPVPAAPVPAL